MRTATVLAAAATAAVAALGGALYLYTRLSARPGAGEDADDAAFGGSAVLSAPRKSATTRSPSPSHPSGTRAGPTTAAVDDEDDLFVLPTGPRLFSPDVVSASKRGSAGGSAGAQGAAIGRGSAHLLYPKEKAASRGRSRSQAAVASAEAASPGRTPNPGVPGGQERERPPASASPASKKKDEEVYSEGIVERTKAMHVLRAMLSRVDGLEFNDSSSDESDDSGETDVSFNYHVASELERAARDELMDAFAEYEMAMDEKGVRRQRGGNGGSPNDAEDDLTEMGPTLAKMLEYLDISNEREKLRIRRAQLHFAAGTAPSSDDDEDHTHSGGLTQFVTHAHEEEHRRLARGTGSAGEDEAEDDGGEGTTRGLLGAAPARGRPLPKDVLDSLMSRLMAASAEGGRHPAGDQAALRYAAMDAEPFEDAWDDEGEGEGEDAEAHAAFMEYLEQHDGRVDFMTRREVEQLRRDRRDPTVVRVVNEDGTRFTDAYDDWFERRGSGLPAGGGGGGEAGLTDTDHYDMMRKLMGGDDDSEEFEDEFEDEDEGGGDDEGLGLANGSPPWSDREKAEFEADLMVRIREMAEVWGVTEDMGARQLAKDEEEREQRREARRAAKAARAPPQRSIKPVAAARAEAPAVSSASGGDDSGDDEEWEDIDEDD